MLTNKRYIIYLNNNIFLAQNIVIKLDNLVSKFDYYVYEKTGNNAFNDNLQDKKYYLNLSGEYHYLDKQLLNKKTGFDKIIIKSLDSNSDIEFTKENLEINRATKNAYLFGSRYYKELISLYPEQELLIRGIILPTDINKLINSKNGEIVNYPKYLVEDQEYDLINNLQQWLYNHVEINLNEGYSFIDNLYIASYIYILTNNILLKLLNLRLSFCKTAQAHSYHINEYLLSFGIPSNILDYLTINQKMYFYKNLRYIRKNVGKNNTLENIIKNTLTVRNIPIYEIRQNHGTDLIDNNNINPELLFKRIANNEIAKSTKLLDYDFDELIDKINILTIDNEEYNAENKEQIKKELIYSKSSTLNTKLLECNTIDVSNSLPYTLQNILINHWIYLSYKNLYNASALINISKNNSSFTITSKQAVALYQYCIFKFSCIENTENKFLNLQLLPIIVNRVLVINKPSFNILKQKINSIYLNDNLLNNVYNNSINSANSIVSILDFSDLCSEIFINANLEYNECAKQEDINSRAELFNFVENLYTTSMINPTIIDGLGNVVTYKNLIDEVGLDLTDYTREDYLNLANVLANTFTLLEIKDTEKLSNVQNAMISLLKKLSSYSINLINEINANPIEVISRISCRINVNKQNTYNSYYVDSSKATILNNNASNSFYRQIDLNNVLNSKYAYFNVFENTNIPIQVPIITTNQNNLNKTFIKTNFEINKVNDVSEDFSLLPDDIKQFFLNLQH